MARIPRPYAPAGGCRTAKPGPPGRPEAAVGTVGRERVRSGTRRELTGDPMSTKHLTVLATAALAAVLLTGCSAGGSTTGTGSASQGATTGANSSGSSSAPTEAADASGTQSKADACQAFESKVRSAAEGLQSQAAKLQSDPAAAVAKLKEARLEHRRRCRRGDEHRGQGQGRGVPERLRRHGDPPRGDHQGPEVR